MEADPLSDGPPRSDPPNVPPDSRFVNRYLNKLHDIGIRTLVAMLIRAICNVFDLQNA